MVTYAQLAAKPPKTTNSAPVEVRPVVAAAAFWGRPAFSRDRRSQPNALPAAAARRGRPLDPEVAKKRYLHRVRRRRQARRMAKLRQPDRDGFVLAIEGRTILPATELPPVS